MTPSELLDACTAEGIVLTRDGDELAVDAPNSGCLAPWLPALRTHKRVLLDELDLRAEIVRVATEPTAEFTRAELDALWRLHAAWNDPTHSVPDMTHHDGRFGAIRREVS